MRIPYWISQISRLYWIKRTRRSSTRFERWKPGFTVTSPSAGVRSSIRSLDQRRSTSPERSVLGSKAKIRRETAVIAAGRPDLVEHAGKGVTATNWRAPCDSGEARNRVRHWFRACNGGNIRPLPAAERGLDRRALGLPSNETRSQDRDPWRDVCLTGRGQHQPSRVPLFACQTVAPEVSPPLQARAVSVTFERSGVINRPAETGRSIDENSSIQMWCRPLRLGAGRSHLRYRSLSESRRRIVWISRRLPCCRRIPQLYIRASVINQRKPWL